MVKTCDALSQKHTMFFTCIGIETVVISMSVFPFMSFTARSHLILTIKALINRRSSYSFILEILIHSILFSTFILSVLFHSFLFYHYLSSFHYQILSLEYTFMVSF